MRGTWAAAIVVASACGGFQGFEPPRPVGPKPVVTGQVLLDGEPVPYFDIAITQDLADDGIYSRPTPVHSKDGRFQVSAAHDGVWAVTISGPDFATRQNFVDLVGGPNDFGNICVSRGHIVEGTIRNDHGEPVARARVLLVASWPDDVDDDLVRLAKKANRTAISDADGHYRLEHVAHVLRSSRLQLVASTKDGDAAWPVDVVDRDATADIVVRPAGSIEVSATGGVGWAAVAVAHPREDPTVTLVAKRDGNRFRFSRVPVGDYEIQLYSPWVVQRTVQPASVSSGTAVAITMAAPADPPVEVTLHASRECTSIAVTSGDERRPIATAPCAGRAATFSALQPASYMACPSVQYGISPCEMIIVDPSPPNQTIEIATQQWTHKEFRIVRTP